MTRTLLAGRCDSSPAAFGRFSADPIGRSASSTRVAKWRFRPLAGIHERPQSGSAGPFSRKPHQRAFDQQASPSYLALAFRATISLASTRSKTVGLPPESKERLKVKASGLGPLACSRSSLAVDSMKVGTSSSATHQIT
jgi:hypothetical protein